jgi:hypothetical protein
MSFNRYYSVMPNILEVDAGGKGRSAFVKIAIPEKVATMLMTEMVRDESKTDKVLGKMALCWKDIAGISVVPAEKSLRELLAEDIADRYNHEEYYDYDTYQIEEDLSRDIMDRYNNQEYWDKEIVMEYLDNRYLSEDDISLIMSMMPDSRIAEILLSQKTEV